MGEIVSLHEQEQEPEYAHIKRKNLRYIQQQAFEGLLYLCAESMKNLPVEQRMGEAKSRFKNIHRRLSWLK